MLCYYVIGGNGRRYGPADENTLAQWAREGRLVHTSALIEVESGRRLIAGSLASLARAFEALPRPDDRVRNDRVVRNDRGACNDRGARVDRPARHDQAARDDRGAPGACGHHDHRWANRADYARDAAYADPAGDPAADPRIDGPRMYGPHLHAPRVQVNPVTDGPANVRVRRGAPPRRSDDGYDGGEPIGPRNKIAAALLALLMPGLGLHRFYLGFPGIAILQILTLPLCGIGAAWGFIEGILCLTGSMCDAEGRRLRD